MICTPKVRQFLGAYQECKSLRLGWFALEKWQISSLAALLFLFTVVLAFAAMFNPPNGKPFGYQITKNFYKNWFFIYNIKTVPENYNWQKPAKYTIIGIFTGELRRLALIRTHSLWKHWLNNQWRRWVHNWIHNFNIIFSISYYRSHKK